MYCMSSCNNSRRVHTVAGLSHRLEETPGGCTWQPVYLLSWSPSSSSWINRSQPSLSTAKNTNSRYKTLSRCSLWNCVRDYPWTDARITLLLSYHMELDHTRSREEWCNNTENSFFLFYPECRRGPGITWICSGCLFLWSCARSWGCPGTWRPPSSPLPT